MIEIGINIHHSRRRVCRPRLSVRNSRMIWRSASKVGKTWENLSNEIWSLNTINLLCSNVLILVGGITRTILKTFPWQKWRPFATHFLTVARKSNYLLEVTKDTYFNIERSLINFNILIQIINFDFCSINLTEGSWNKKSQEDVRNFLKSTPLFCICVIQRNKVVTQNKLP